jgi:Txe/YoeB family toxin of toxin-antitoxin system
MVEPWKVLYTPRAKKHIALVRASPYEATGRKLIELVRRDPLQNPPPFEKLVGLLKGAYSRRINAQHRFVYQIFKEERIVRILALWRHYN